MFKALNGKGVSTALATIAIILVLVMSLTWMAYTVVLNARQQAQAAERAESIALKAKELIRVYVWLDPAQQPNGQYLNLTRISFVGSWSGETTINGLLVVYRDGGSRMLGLNIRLGAGEEKTYLPSELGIPGLDNYDAFKIAVKYIQAHTSLGNDFVSLWGRPDKPAIYIVTTTNTGTTTTATTPPTTTTSTTTTTPPPTTTTTTPPPTVTTTVTVTETQYVSTRCTDVDWRYTTVTSWYTSTVYAGAVTTSTQWVTSTAWVTSTIPTTVTVWTTSTQTQTAWTVVTSWTTVTTVTTTTSWDYTTVTITRTVTNTYTVTQDIRQISWPAPGVRDQAPDNEQCGTRLVMLAAYNAHVRPSETMEGVDVSPALLVTVTALMAYGSIGRHVGARRILMLLFSIRGVTIILLVFIPLFAVVPVSDVLAQVTTTVTSTRTVTSTVCTATTTVTSTSTVTQNMPTTTTITTTGTITVTSTATTTRTSYTTQTYTVSSTYYTSTYVTSTTTWTYTETTTSWATTTRWITISETTWVAKTTTTTIARCSWNCWGVCDGSIGCCECVY